MTNILHFSAPCYVVSLCLLRKARNLAFHIMWKFICSFKNKAVAPASTSSSTFIDVKQVVVPSFSHKFILKCKSHSTQTEHIRTTLPPQPCKFVLDMCALNRLTFVRSLFFAEGLVNQSKMLYIVRHVNNELFFLLDHCSSTYSYRKFLKKSQVYGLLQ